MAVGVIFAVLFGNSSSAVLGELIGSALMSGYSREAEREADNLGVVHTMRAGYNPYSMLISMEKLEAMSGKSDYGLFSSHPDTANRVKAVKEQVINDFKVRPIVKETDKYAQVTDGQWNLPAFYSKYAGYSPRMRAYLTAGRIYRLTSQADYSSDKLYINDMENATGVYYNEDKEPLVVVTPQDATANGLGGMNEMAQLVIARIRERAGR